jgi:transcriptional regulator with XRE-family HTH domain
MDQDKIAALIKTIRKDNNLTQQELGDSLGVTAQAVSKWENGKNIPDIAVLKEISDKYNIDINNILDGQNIQKKRSKLRFVNMIIGMIALTIFFVVIILSNNGKFKSTRLSSSCKQFDLQGILSYDKNKSSISISNIEYCGNEDKIEYDEISSKLYEKVNDNNVEIASSDTEYNIELKKYLDKLTFNITNYEQQCKNYKSNIIGLEIIGIKNGVEEKFIIPLTLEEDC